MIRTAYKLVTEAGSDLPIIAKVEITDLEGVSWREVKKQLRQWYLDQAGDVRSIREKDYFAVCVELDSGSLSEDGIELVSIEHPQVV